MAGRSGTLGSSSSHHCFCFQFSPPPTQLCTAGDQIRRCLVPGTHLPHGFPHSVRLSHHFSRYLCRHKNLLLLPFCHKPEKQDQCPQTAAACHSPPKPLPSSPPLQLAHQVSWMSRVVSLLHLCEHSRAGPFPPTEHPVLPAHV